MSRKIIGGLVGLALAAVVTIVAPEEVFRTITDMVFGGTMSVIGIKIAMIIEG